MNILPSITFLKPKSIVPQQIMSDSWVERKTILQDDVNLFCWKRAVKPELTKLLQSYLHRANQPISFVTSSDRLAHDLGIARLFWDPESNIESNIFWEDVSRLCLDFLAFSKTGFGNVHLKVIDNNACSKFHVDGYSLRLFTTY